MKCSRDSRYRLRRLGFAVLAVAMGGAVSALGELPTWIRNVEAGNALEAVFFRMMSLPGGAVAFRRPPRETRPALADLIQAQPHSAEVYSLRALEDEQGLDFVAAESDWKAYVENSSDRIDAEISLADFYHRQLRPADEIKTLSLVANARSIESESLTATTQQRSWRAFERIFGVIHAQGLPKDVSITQYRAWIARYPAEQSLYARFLQLLVAEKEYAAAGQLVAEYRKQFPNDQVFPVKADAMVEYRRGSAREGLAVYERSFQPLWDPQLVNSYFDLLRDTQNLRKFRDDAHAALVANPGNLNAAVRTFYYYQQQGKIEVAQQTISDFRVHKEASHAAWTSQELYICARLLEDIHAYPESARYYFALYNSQGMADAQEKAVAGLTSLLLTAPETPIRLGSGELSMYSDIATLDQGPGYLNGILSLLLNTTQPAAHYAEEEQRAVPYFHRSRAAELLELLDTRFPNSPRRPSLHAQLLEFYANSGESDAVIHGGREFLAKFPQASERTSVALLMADAYARNEDTQNEFAIYDAVLKELAARAQNVPLGSSQARLDESYRNSPSYAYETATAAESEEGSDIDEQQPVGEQNPAARHRVGESFPFAAATSPTQSTGPRSPEYASVLDRYLARLVQMKQIPAALAVLNQEIERSPDDPGLYERLAVFLDQNRLGSQQEEVYRRAIARFSDKSWYDKLARFYLRHKRDSEFEQLTRDAVKSFEGGELEQYFDHVVGGSPALYLSLNLYAHQRFPHNPVFVRNLLIAYRSPHTGDPAAWEALLRQHWFEDTGLRAEFFEYLASTGKLQTELSAIRETAPDAASWQKNPAAADFIAQADLWRSHFEESAPLLESLAEQYPADAEIADTAASVFRSLAYFEPADTAMAAKIQDKFLRANPTNTEIMARIGDIYSDHDQFAKAAPYWERIPQVAPGESGGYLEAATIYWDYFDFENALRLLGKGRERLANPTLYAYEAGAIYENQRDYPRAIGEYVKGALNAPDSLAELRLLQLARRPKLHDLVDQSTAQIAALPNPAMPAVNLRVKVLEAQNRKPEIDAFLDSVVNGTSSIGQAENVETLAQQKSLETVRQHALEKQASLTTDPVRRLELHYALIRLYEGRKNFAAAQKNVEALYRESPRILGVVRSTVDFYWRMKMQSQAISVLLQAANDSYPALSAQFRYEAARKSTDAKQFQQSRDQLNQLLKDSPYNGEYLAAMADTYAQAGDDNGLEAFYQDEIALFRNAPLAADVRKTQIAMLRRGLIPALTRMGNYSGAVDQYIELINNFPEDDALVTEAALYAMRYRRRARLVDFYTETVERSPRDYRWSMVLARTLTDLENYPAAIETYGKSIVIRPDRADLYVARAGLEERLMRFDDAAADYARIYQLAYKDPQWMEKLAAVRARQSKVQEVVAALQAALIEGRPENANNYFEVARRIESWGMLDQARNFAEQGVAKAGSELLADAQYQSAANTYVRILTRLRQQGQALATLQKALDESGAALPVVKEQMEKQGFAGLTDAQWRENVRRQRMETARNGMAGALREMGIAVNTYFTPEERLAFAQFAESQFGESKFELKTSSMARNDVEQFAIPLAQSAALADQEAHWRFETAMWRAAQPPYFPNTQELVDLQRRRGRFAELGTQMEQIGEELPSLRKSGPLLAAADAYASAGDEANELRVLSSVFGWGLDATHQQRFFHLLLARKPEELVRIAQMWASPASEQAADYAVAHGNAALAHTVVQARGQARPPVWSKAYNALVGLYFSEPTPAVNNAFLAVLGDDPISARLANPVDRAQQLAGNVWFYYGSRYGDYLGTAKLGNPEDFLPAILEESPASASGYLTLAEYYVGVGETKNAIDDYNHTLELSPNRPDVYDDLAIAYFIEGDRAAALQEWKQGFAELSTQLDGARLPESFWADFVRTCDQLASHHLFGELKPDAEAIVRTYLRRNGNYRSNALLHSIYAASGDPATATPRLLDLSTAAHDPTLVLADVADAWWIPLTERAPIYRRILESKQAAVTRLNGLERQYAEQDLSGWQVRWIRYLTRTKQFDAAAAAIAAIPQETRDAQAATLVPLELRVAAQLGTLDAKLSAYRTEPQGMPAPEILRMAARQLFEAGDKQSARKLLEFVFAREIEEHQLVAANFLGLAEIRLASGDTAGALDLLHRLVIALGNPFENLDPAAALLEKTGHYAEAIEFLDQLVRSAPWDPSYRLRLAKAKLAAATVAADAEKSLAEIGAAPDASYEVRLKAAAALSGRPHGDLGSGELNLLASAPGEITAPAADKFYFYAARIHAARNAADTQTKIQLLSHCIIDFPQRNEARVPLFQAAVAAQSNEYALAVMQPLLESQFLRNQAQEGDSEEEQIVSSAFDEEQNESNTPIIAAAKLTRAEQAQVAQVIGDTLSRLGQVADALPYYQSARRLESSPERHKTLLRKIADARAQLRIERQNAARQPLLHEALEQDRVVRSRLLARAAPGSKSVAAKGGVKP